MPDEIAIFLSTDFIESLRYFYNFSITSLYQFIIIFFLI